jgi:hypothetical protein
MNTAIHGKPFLNPLLSLRISMFFVAATLLDMNCCSILAQAQSGNPQKAGEPRNASPSGPEQTQAVEQLTHQVEAAESNLQKLREQLRTNNPSRAQAQKDLGVLLDLENRLLQLSQGEPNESTKAEIAKVTDAINRAAAVAQTRYLLEKKPEQSPELQQLQQMKEQLAEREKQMGMMAKQLMEQQHRRPLPPLENGTMKIYKLNFAPARDAAQTIESLFGAETLRLAVDERSNTLIVYSKPDSVTALDALMSRLDEQAAAAAGSDKSKQNAITAPRSLLLRVFWLADGLPEGVGQNPGDFLPKSVLQATNKLGLEAPRLVTQSVNSLALGREEAVDFLINVPAVLLGQPVGLDSDGRLKLVSDDRVRLEMRVHVGGPTVNCELRGSLATPLGHYMVFGTANSVMAEGTPMAGMMGPGMMPGGGPVGPEGSRPGFGAPGQPIRGGEAPGPGGGRFYGPEGGAAGPGAGPGGQVGGPGGGQQPGKPSFNSSRFAFVVQVIEGQSYPAEKGKSDGE